jgi:hypothetical protein
VSATPLNSGPSAGINALAFRSQQHGLAVGGDFALPANSPNNFAGTRNGGRSWGRSPARRPSTGRDVGQRQHGDRRRAHRQRHDQEQGSHVDKLDEEASPSIARTRMPAGPRARGPRRVSRSLVPRHRPRCPGCGARYHLRERLRDVLEEPQRPVTEAELRKLSDEGRACRLLLGAEPSARTPAGNSTAIRPAPRRDRRRLPPGSRFSRTRRGVDDSCRTRRSGAEVRRQVVTGRTSRRLHLAGRFEHDILARPRTSEGCHERRAGLNRETRLSPLPWRR